MPESTLSLQYSDILEQLGYQFGAGVSRSGWTAEQEGQFDFIVQQGVKQFYYPPVIPGENVRHEWTFMSPVASLNTVQGIEDYDAPADYGGMKGRWTFEANDGWRHVSVVGEHRVRQLRQRGIATGRPYWVAERPKAFDASTGQRFEFIMYPQPDAVYELIFRYIRNADRISDTNPFPLGGMQHGDTILASCFEVAERRMDDESTIHRQYFYDRMAASIQIDRQSKTADTFGYNSDHSDDFDLGFKRHDFATFNGILYDGG